MTTITHSPLPFSASPIKSCVLDARGLAIAAGLLGIFNQMPIEERDANVEFIVRACNAHEALFYALEKMLVEFDDRSHEWELDNGEPRLDASWPGVAEARIALAKAREQL